MPAPVASLDSAFVAAFRSGQVSQAQLEAIVPSDRAAVIFFFLQLSVAVAGGAGRPASTAHQPSGVVPPYAKPPASPRRKPRGARAGHVGASRPRPEVIDRRETHQLSVCPCCGGALVRTGRVRTRVIEDIPENLKPEVAEHTIHRDWCPRCKKQVEPKVADALARCQFGNRTVALSAWLHYGLGITTSQIVEVLGRHLRLPISEGGLTQMWHRTAEVVMPWYEQIRRMCLDAGVLHADETGWRVNGQTWWLWCFATSDATCYRIDESRGHPALEKFFVEEFAGVLVTDFWAAYDAVGATKQKCWPHLLRELEEVDKGSENTADWGEFVKRLRRLYGDAVRLAAKREALSADEFSWKLSLLHGRVVDLAREAWTNPHARRLAKRLEKSGAELLTFVEFEGVPPDNNHAEREVRPAVVMRKTSYGNQSDAGAQTREVLMSVLRTLKKRGRDPLTDVVAALRAYAATDTLPPLPEKVSSEG